MSKTPNSVEKPTLAFCNFCIDCGKIEQVRIVRKCNLVNLSYRLECLACGRKMNYVERYGETILDLVKPVSVVIPPPTHEEQEKRSLAQLVKLEEAAKVK